MEKEPRLVGWCTYCKEAIYDNQSWIEFNGYGMHEMFCSSECDSAEREINPINHSAWKD